MNTDWLKSVNCEKDLGVIIGSYLKVANLYLGKGIEL